MKDILENINIKLLQSYEPNFNNILSEFFLEITKNSYRKSSIYELVLSYLRQSFINSLLMLLT